VITREFEKAGIPIVQWCNMTPVAESIGVNRIMESKSIKYPFGNPDVPPEQEKLERVQMLKKALNRLTQP
jgi:glycine/betaine/sarcosine/D-proline reductase family selenoprotein B